MAEANQGGAAQKLLGALGLCRRAGALEIGFDSVEAACKNSSAQLVLFAADISPKTKKRIQSACRCKTAELLITQADISAVTQKPAGVLAVTNKDLAVLCQNALSL